MGLDIVRVEFASLTKSVKIIYGRLKHSMANLLMMVFTGIIAVATVAYVVVTKRLLRETMRSASGAKDSADAAKISAEVAKRAADLDAARHRPYLAVSVFQRSNDFNADQWVTQWVVKNYGTLPASAVTVEVAVDRDERGDFARTPAGRGCE